MTASTTETVAAADDPTNESSITEYCIANGAVEVEAVPTAISRTCGISSIGDGSNIGDGSSIGDCSSICDCSSMVS